MVYYMSYVGGSNQFIEADAIFIEGEILGHYPETYDEIMIHSYLADLIIVNGVLVYSETEPNHETVFLSQRLRRIIKHRSIHLNWKIIK